MLARVFTNLRRAAGVAILAAALVAVPSIVAPTLAPTAAAATPATLTLTITSSIDGSPVTTGYLSAGPVDGPASTSATIDGTGHATLALPDLGSYVINVSATAPLAVQELVVDVTSPTQSLAVILVQGATISGTSDAPTSPTLFAGVTAYWKSLGGWRWVASTTIDSDGRFTIGALPAGEYRLEVGGATFPAHYWGGSTSWGAATSLTLAVGENRTGLAIPITDPGTSVSAKLTEMPAAGAGQYEFTAIRVGGDPERDAASAVASITTGTESVLLSSRLATGDYTVSYLKGSSRAALSAPVYWAGDNKPGTTDKTKAKAFSAGASQPTAVFGPNKAPVPPAIPTDRISGDDRYSTAVALSKAGYAGTAKTVYLATGANYPDALSAAPAAVKEGGPLLLTPPDAIPSVVSAEIKRLKPSKIVVVGGTSAISAVAFDQLKPLAGNVIRVAGDDRFVTSRAIVQQAFGSAPTAYVATALNYPDALSASAAAAAKGQPVLLVNGTTTTVDAATATLITSLKTKTFLIAGGVNAVSPGIENSLKKSGSVTRLAGSDRFTTSQLINKAAFPGAQKAFFATGFQFPDALAGAALAGVKGAPLYVVQPDCVAGGVVDDLLAANATSITLIGGTNALTPKVAALTRC